MKYLSILLLVVNFSWAQYQVKGEFTDSIPTIKNIALYQLAHGDSKYVKYTEVKDNSFSFVMDSLSSGYYRALYQNISTGYVDFIYDKEDVSFRLDSKKGQLSAEYLVSRENQLLQAYNYNMANLQNKLDSVQLTFFKKPSADVAKYKEIASKIKGAQAYYENLAEHDYCLSIIKASKRYNAPIPFTLPGNYINSIKTHFFDNIDFNDKILINSTFLRSRVNDYIFYLHQNDDSEIQNELFIKAVDEVLTQASSNTVKESLLAFLIKKFVKKELIEVVQHTTTQYKLLPLDLQNPEKIKEFERKSKTLIGARAPDIKLSKSTSLYSLKAHEKYLIIFWSSTCSHCRLTLPKVNKYLSTKKGLKVIAVGIENKEDEQSWLNNTKFYPDWEHTISLGKWESTDAINYNIDGTPSFFLLNTDKKIIAKPKDLEEIKKIL
ncbi:TlpA family protein disulfide reductase [Wenyingzhuangia sp. IMCC45533]